MGANIEYHKLRESQNKIVAHILDNIKNWDGGIESGVELIENNRIEINKIKSINKEIDSMNMTNLHDDEYRDSLNALYIEQKKLFKVLESKQKELIKEKQQFNKRDQVVKNYITKKTESIFIDKDVT